MSQEDNEDNGFPNRWKKKLPVGYEETAERMDNAELKTKIIDYQKAIVQHEKDMENDTKLASYKEQVKELMDVYREPITELRAMSKYLLFVMESRGI